MAIPVGAGILTVIAAAIYGLVVPGLTGTRLHTLPPYALAVAFALAEMFVVHIQFRSEAQTFSLVELPLVLGLFFTPPAWIVPAHLLGAGAALALYRRQPIRKLTYNLAAFALEDVVAVVLFYAIAPDLDVLHRATWLAALAATIAASVLGNATVFVAIALSGGDQSRRDRAESIALGVGATVATTSLALAAAVLTEVDLQATWLLTIPGVGLFVAHRTHVRSRDEQRSLDFLRRSTGLLHSSPDVAASLRALLGGTRDAFRADIAAVVYVPTSDPDSMAQLVVGPGRAGGDLETKPRGAAWKAWEAAVREPEGRLLRVDRDAGRHLLDGVDLTGGMVIPLTVESRAVGYLLVGNRLGDVGRFTPADLDVFGTIAAQVAGGLEDGQLEQPLHQLRVLERQLEHRAAHDAVTGLANAELFATRLSDLLDAPADQIAVIVIEALPQPETRPTKDAEALIVAERLRRCIRDSDLAARLGETQFAVVAEVANGMSGALRIQSRITNRLSGPVVIDGATAPLRIRLGCEVNAAGDTAAVLLARARDDLAGATPIAVASRGSS